jgi:hypothetical protein
MAGFSAAPAFDQGWDLPPQTVEKVEADSMNCQEQFCHSNYAAEMDIAERELFAFIGAVTQLFGPEEAKLSTEDWLAELELMDSPPRSTSRSWRAATIAASARLAKRLAVTQHFGSDRLVGASVRRFFTPGLRGAAGGTKPL